MKSIHSVPPLVALLIAAAWLAYLRRSNSAMEQENRSLQQRIAESRSSPAFQKEPARAGSIGTRAKSGERPPEQKIKPSTDWVSTSRDWSRLVLSINDEAKYRYTAAWKRLEKLASEMTADELVKAYAEMTALAVNAPLREDLEWIMLKELETKDPEFAFSQYIAKYQSEGKAPARIGTFDKWLARDPVAATTWYENQLASGVFYTKLGGKSPVLLPFESAFIMSLLGSDPSAAEQRMRNIPPELRGGLGGYMWDVPKGNAQAFVDLLRQTMPMEEYMAILRKNSVTEKNFSLSSDTNPQSVTKNLDSLGISPEERSSLMAHEFRDFAEYRAMRDRGNAPSREKFDAHRRWIQAIDPSSADRATGFALQTYLEKTRTTGAQEFVERIAMEYHASGAGDELLVPLIQGSANGNVPYPRERARVLAMMISDTALREALLKRLN
jgi:hypothetical protein